MQQQNEKVRKKRDYNPGIRFPGLSFTPSPTTGLGLGSLLKGIAPQSRLEYRDATPHTIFPDPLFKEQWYLVSRVCAFFSFYFINFH